MSSSEHPWEEEQLKFNPPRLAGSDRPALLFLDLETTGLDPEQGVILEIAAVAVNERLEALRSCAFLIRHEVYPLSEWCLVQHRESGLLNACAQSEFNTRDAEISIIKFCEIFAPRNDWGEPAVEAIKPIILAGDSIHFDRAWIKKHMRQLERILHYRMVDVSTLKELHRIFNLPAAPEEGLPHRALADCLRSIDKLKFYTGGWAR